MSNSNIKGIVTISAVVTRADGTVEDLGVISEHSQEINKAVLNTLAIPAEKLDTLSSEEESSKEE